MSEGRSCPLAYRYQPSDLCRHPRQVNEDVLYIIGGLYGNPYALDEIEHMALAEERQGHRVKLVFNGDVNWFNASDSLFREINCRVLDHTVSLGQRLLPRYLCLLFGGLKVSLVHGDPESLAGGVGPRGLCCR